MIRCEQIMPPIPERKYDWCAYDDDQCGCPECHRPVGYGATEQEAIADLLEQLREKLSNFLLPDNREF